jgi:sarcosine oxidase subunit beta
MPASVSAGARSASTRCARKPPSVRDLFRKRRMWRRRSELKERYDVVIIGGGSHGLAAAYYLRQRGITDVAVLEKGYIGSGAAGRNTTILRSNYKTPEGARFYDASIRLYEGLSRELNFNLLFSQCGHLTLAHSDRAMFVMANRAEVNRLNGIDSRLIDAAEVTELCPAMYVGEDATYPIMGALYHPPGGIIRHDAVVWGFARGADAGGAEIHPYTEVAGLERTHGRIDAVRTNRGTVRAGVVLNCTAGWSTLLCDMAGVALPITTHVLQACVTEPIKPLLNMVIVSSQMHVYLSQSDRGEFVMGSEIEPWTTYRTDNTLSFLQELTRHTLELFPQLEHARLLRAWAGLCDLSPDYSPILGQTEVENFHISAGWGTYGFKAAPIVGQTLAELVATGRTPELIAPFSLERFYEDRLVSELAAAAVSH